MSDYLIAIEQSHECILKSLLKATPTTCGLLVARPFWKDLHCILTFKLSCCFKFVIIVYGMVWYGMACRTVWYGLSLYDMVYHVNLWYVCYDMVWYDLSLYGLSWYGMACHCMVWYGMVCYAMLWPFIVLYSMVW